MKCNKLIYTALVLLCLGCADEQKWTDDYDINFPAPTIETINRTKVEVGDTLHLTGFFEKLTTATIGDGYTKIVSISEDYKTAKLLVTESCISGKLVLQNIYKQKYTHQVNITVENSGIIEIPKEITILDFSNTKFSPYWTKSTWTEAKNFESEGYDLNPIAPPTGYDHFYSMNDTTLFPPNEPAGQGGNIPYGNYTYDNDGNGFNIAQYADPYVSVLINTGNDIAYLSLVINDEVKDFDPSHSVGGTFANGEKKHYMKTDNKWLWYSFSLKSMLGKDLPNTIKSAGLFIRNSWDYGADIYPGFQLNIAKMVITDGVLPRKIVLFDFEDGEPETTTEVTSWASDLLSLYGRDLSNFSIVPSGTHYYSMTNHHDENFKSYKFAIKNDNNGVGFNLSEMKAPYLTFAVNTGEHSGFIDFVFYQAASGNKEGEPWADPGCNNSALEVYPEATAQENVMGFYFDTKEKWEWRTYDLIKLLKGVEEWGLQGGAYPNFKEKFDYVLIWPRDGWNNDLASGRYEMNIDYVIITDGLPTGLPTLNQ